MGKLTKEERAKRVKDLFPNAYGDSSELKELVEGTVKPIYDLIPENAEKDRAWIGDNPHFTIDYNRVKDIRMPQKGLSLKDANQEVVDLFNGLEYNGSALIMPNVYPQINKVTFTSAILSNVFCPNIIDGEYGVNTQRAELEAGSMLADMVGWEPTKAGCIFTYGGEGGWTYGVKYALSRVLKNSRKTGVREDAKIICSQEAQFSKLCAVDWSGLGLDNLIQIPANKANEMDLEKLEEVLKDLHAKNIPVAAVVCTEGTTDANAFDDIGGVKALLEKYPNDPNKYGKALIYADSVIGFSWAVFLKYDFEANPLGFDEKVLSHIKKILVRVADLKYADAFAADFHKSGYCPYVATSFVYKDAAEFEGLLSRVEKPAEGEKKGDTYAYLQDRSPYNPMEYTLESSRSGQGSIASWATLKYFGLEGFQLILGVQVERHEYLREFLDKKPNFVVVNSHDYGDVTLFRVYPSNVVDAKAQYAKEYEDKTALDDLVKHNDFVRQVGDLLWEWFREGKKINGHYTPYISYSSGFTKAAYNFGAVKDPKAVIYALKIYPLNINVDEKKMEWVIDCIERAAKEVETNIRK